MPLLGFPSRSEIEELLRRASGTVANTPLLGGTVSLNQVGQVADRLGLRTPTSFGDVAGAAYDAPFISGMSPRQVLENLDRPGAALRGGLEAGYGGNAFDVLGGAYRGFQNPEEYGTGDILRRAGVDDDPLPGFVGSRLGLSGRDVAGGIGDAVLDPLSLVPIGKGAQTARRGAVRAAESKSGQRALRLTRRLVADETGSVGLFGKMDDAERATPRVLRGAPYADLPSGSVRLFRGESASGRMSPLAQQRGNYSVSESFARKFAGDDGAVSYVDVPRERAGDWQLWTDSNQLERLPGLGFEEIHSLQAKGIDPPVLEYIQPPPGVGQRGSMRLGALAGHEAIGGVTGGVSGYATGDTREERERNALLGAVTGLALGRAAASPAVRRGALRLARDESAAVGLPKQAARRARKFTPAGPFQRARSAAEELFGLKDPEVGLSRMEERRAAVTEAIGRNAPLDPVATPLMRARKQAQPRITSQANVSAAELATLARRHFKPDAQGRIADLPGAPTIQDVAARLPEFDPYLKPPQRSALARMAEVSTKYRAFLDEVGIGETLGVRTDIMDGGFYLPRGSALEEGSEVPLKIRAGRGGGKSGFQKEAVFTSMADGIDAGFTYRPFRDALQGTFQVMGTKGADAWTAQRLRPFGRAIPESGGAREAGQIGTPLPLQGLEFPDAIANAVNQQLLKEGPTTGAGSDVVNAVGVMNSMLRFSQATGEMSHLGIQGVVGMLSDFPAYSKAAKLAVQALMDHGDDVLGSYFVKATERAAQKGMPTPADWAAHGGHVGGAETEMSLGRGLSGKAKSTFENLPVVRQTNRGFGYFGDILRQELREGLWEDAARKGPVPDEVLGQIAQATNRVTGWSERRSFGSLGDALQFAPRFFQARLEALADTRKLVTGDKYERMIAANTMGRFLGIGTLMTIALNEALGNDTDFQPIKDGKYNSNFMRVRWAGRDWSLFGPYNSLVGLMMTAGTGDVPGSARVLFNSPVVSTAWDLISGSDFLGEATRNTKEGEPFAGLLSGQTAKYLAKRPLPFGASNAAEAVGQAASGDMLGALGSTISAVGGFKSNLVTLHEQRDMMVQSWSRGKQKEYRKLDATEKLRFDEAHPTLAERIIKERIERGGTFGRAEELKQQSLQKQEQSDQRLQSRQIDIEQWRADLHDRELALRSRRDEVLRDLPDDGSESLVGRYFDQFDEAERPDGTIDWSIIDEWRSRLSESENDLIDRSTGTGGTAMVRAHRATTRALTKSGFWEIRDGGFRELKESDDGSDELLAESKSYDEWQRKWIDDKYAQLLDQGVDPRAASARAELLFSSNKTKLRLDKINRRIRTDWLEANPDLALDAMAAGYLSPGKATLETLGQPQ